MHTQIKIRLIKKIKGGKRVSPLPWWYRCCKCTGWEPHCPPTQWRRAPWSWAASHSLPALWLVNSAGGGIRSLAYYHGQKHPACYLPYKWLLHYMIRWCLFTGSLFRRIEFAIASFLPVVHFFRRFALVGPLGTVYIFTRQDYCNCFRNSLMRKDVMADWIPCLPL
jgi:hypothetical protein